MFKKILPTLLIGSCMSMSVFAHEHEEEYWEEWDAVLAISGGIAFVNTQLSSEFPLGNNPYNYSSHDSSDANGLWGVFAGAETEVDENWDAQFGIGYYWTKANADATVTQGALPDQFNSSYTVTSQQILAEGKLLWEATEIFFPYVTGGLGIAINDTHNFNVDLDNTVNMSPAYGSHTETSFSWMVGAGVDAQLAEAVRLGLAYRFTGFGKYGLGSGTLQDGTPVDGTVSSSDLYANEIVAQLSYLFDL